MFVQTVMSLVFGRQQSTREVQYKVLEVKHQWIALIILSWKVTTVYSSPQKLQLVLLVENRHQQITSSVTRVLVD